MQDRFKFRAWNKLSNEMKDVITLNINQEFPDCSNVILETNTFDAIKTHNNLIICANGLNNVILMQCTGLKDKNGKLIYEGDIVKNNQNSLYSVEFEEFENQTKFCLKRIENPDYYPHISTWQGIGYKDQKNYEVIGNIYENEELLK